jgi:hypothetical protein
VKSYRVIKHLEKQNLGIDITTLITKQLIQYLANVFVDNTSFYSSRNKFKSKIQQIINQCTKLYEVTGGLIEHDKSYSYSWKWKMIRRKEHLIDIKTDIEIYNVKIKQILSIATKRALKVYINLSLTWNE